MIDAEIRFWSKVSRTPYCWNWTGAKTGNGLGIFWFKGKNLVVSRYSWELHNSIIPTGLLVCHKCDNGLCVRPGHLFLGTQKENMQDALRKGRCKNKTFYGEDHPAHKLVTPQILAIRRAKNSTHKQLAKKYGVCLSTIDRIIAGRLWKTAPFFQAEEGL